MDFIKNLFSNFQSVDTNGTTIPEELSQNICNENVHPDINIQDLMTSQSSDDISDLFTNELSNEISNSPTNTEKNEITTNLKDIREFTEDENCKSVVVSNENLNSICSNENSEKNIDIEEIVLNLDEFEASFNEVRDIVNECDENYKFKENNGTEEPAINLDDFEEFLDNIDETDIDCNERNEAVANHIHIENASENNNKPNVADENINTDICLDEFENIFKSYDNVDSSERVRTTDDAASSQKTETIENTYVTEVPIGFHESEMNHDYTNLIEDVNILTEEFKHDNINIESIEIEIDFEADLKSNIISKLDPMVVIETENQPTIWKDVNSDISKIKNNTLCEDINDRKDDKNSIISISDSNSDVSYTENNTLYEDLNDKYDITSVISIASKSTNSTKPMENNSITSTQNYKNYDSDYCSGYNSSDFEFISEDEAQDGLIVNCWNKKLGTPKKSSTVHTLEISKDKSYISSSSEESIARENAGPSHSRNYKNVYYKPINTNYRQNHRIPEDDEYLKLFQGVQFTSDLLFLENKSVRPTTSMSMQFRDVGFDMVGVRKEDSEDGYKDEAEESAKKILSMYPGENRKRRRRRF